MTVNRSQQRPARNLPCSARDEHLGAVPATSRRGRGGCEYRKQLFTANGRFRRRRGRRRGQRRGHMVAILVLVTTELLTLLMDGIAPHLADAGHRHGGEPS